LSTWKSAQVAEQGVDGGIPGLVSGRVGELVGPGHIAGGIDVGVERLQVGVSFDRAAGGDAELLEAEALQPRLAADGAEQAVKADPLDHPAALHEGFAVSRTPAGWRC